MQAKPKPSRKAAAHLAGAGAYILIALIGAITYVLFFKATGPKANGMVGGAIVIFLPMMLLGFGLLVWIPVWTILKRMWGAVSPARAAMAATVLGVLGTIFYCGGGFSCFRLGSTEHMVGWFFVVCAALGTAAHSAVYRRIAGKNG